MATIKRNASAQWSGTGKEGKGAITTQSGVLSETPYSFARRFGEEKGTNPEELIAAAHAGCFTMALAFQLSGAGHEPERLETRADISITQENGGWKIDSVQLQVKAKVAEIEDAKFKELAEKAKTGCPVSKLLNAKITLKADLV
jgi:osmotically inducible protein OsmC